MPTSDQLAKYASFQQFFRKVPNRPTWVREDVALAQVMLETGWGTSDLWRSGGNAYGMSCNSRSYQSACWTRPSDGHRFAWYVGAVNTHADYIARMVQFDATNGYSKARSLDEYLQALNPTNGRPRYAAESGYNDAIKAVMKSVNPDHPELQTSTVTPNPTPVVKDENGWVWWAVGGAVLGGLWLWIPSRRK